MERTDKWARQGRGGWDRGETEIDICTLFVVAVQLLSPVQLFTIPWTTALQASLSSTVSWSLLQFMSIESVMLSNHLILCRPLLSSVLPTMRVFSNESALPIRWPKYYSFSLSISPSNATLRIDFLWDWLVWSPCSPRDSQSFYPAPQFESISSLALSLFYGLALISVHDYWKKHCFDYTDICQQDDVSPFNMLP